MTISPSWPGKCCTGIFYSCNPFILFRPKNSTVLTKLFSMNHRPPDLLSSSRFPMTTSGLSEGGARSSFEYIYTNFTNRELSKLKDRRYAVSGLERRLKELYNLSEITYGIVHSCLQTSLLWQRSGRRLEDIKDEETKEIPLHGLG
jgi:hypothetical protein